MRFTDPSGHIPCNDPADCNPGQGGDDQPTDDPNVQPEPETPYCEQYPEANGCALPPANTDDNQGPDDDGECNLAGCEGEDTAPTINPSEEAKCRGRGCEALTYYYTLEINHEKLEEALLAPAEFIALNLLPFALTALAGAEIGIGIALCTTVIGCVAGVGLAVVGGGATLTAVGLTAYAAWQVDTSIFYLERHDRRHRAK